MKRLFSLILALIMVISLAVTASAADESRSYEFDLSVNGEHKVYAAPGDIITLILRLKRTDSSEPATMYAMQDEINYDSTFLQLVEGGSIASAGIVTKDIALRDTHRAYYMNFVDMGGGREWQADTMIGTFQMKVLAETGTSKITNENCRVSVQDGSDSFAVTVNDVTVIVSLDCIIHFETNGGSELANVVVEAGQKLEKPKDPVKEGYVLEGWYQDMDLQEPWDFENDVVEGNMTLYAKWVEGEAVTGFNWLWIILLLILLAILLLLFFLFRKKTVKFDTNGGSEVYDRKVRKGKKMSSPRHPYRDGFVFDGWYKDPMGMELWDFENDTVEENMTLYAKWM